MYPPPVILPYKGKTPKIHPSAFIAPGVVIAGDVEIGAHSSVWFGCVLRGDVNHIRIGARTNIQDGTIIHVSRMTAPTLIGDEVTIGHKVLIHGGILENSCFVGMSSTVMDKAVIESGGMLAAGALLTAHKRIRSGELWAGSPAKLFRPLHAEEAAFISVSAENYVELGQEYAAGLQALAEGRIGG